MIGGCRTRPPCPTFSTPFFFYFLRACLCSFYRYVLAPDVSFMANDTVSAGPTARFLELPESPLLTLNMITPESWMVQAVSSPYDLDNIHLQEVLQLFAQQGRRPHRV